MYGERCPKEFIKFDRRDVKSHLSLNDEQRSVVADYLNATFYNDFIVDSIIRMFSDRNAIVIYFPTMARRSTISVCSRDVPISRQMTHAPCVANSTSPS